MTETPPRVFISYDHEDDGAHAEWVRALAHRLRDDGVDAWIDRYVPFPPNGWRRRMTEQIEAARWVLVVCTEEDKLRKYTRALSAMAGVEDLTALEDASV